MSESAESVSPAERRDARGRRVREVWVEWAKQQPAPKPSWLIPYDELDEADKEVDRRIGSALWGDGFREGVNFGLATAAAIQTIEPETAS